MAWHSCQAVHMSEGLVSIDSALKSNHSLSIGQPRDLGQCPHLVNGLNRCSHRVALRCPAGQHLSPDPGTGKLTRGHGLALHKLRSSDQKYFIRPHLEQYLSELSALSFHFLSKTKLTYQYRHPTSRRAQPHGYINPSTPSAIWKSSL